METPYLDERIKFLDMRIKNGFARSETLERCKGELDEMREIKQLALFGVSNQRELLTQFAVFMAKNIERGKTPASLVNDFYEKLG